PTVVVDTTAPEPSVESNLPCKPVIEKLVVDAFEKNVLAVNVDEACEMMPPLNQLNPVEVRLVVVAPLWKLTTPEKRPVPATESVWPGVVVPIPSNPAAVMRAASVRLPVLRTENARSAFAPPKFCWSIEVMAAVVVALLYASLVMK